MSFEEALVLGKYYGEKAKVPVVLHIDHDTDESVARNIIKEYEDIEFK